MHIHMHLHETNQTATSTTLAEHQLNGMSEEAAHHHPSMIPSQYSPQAVLIGDFARRLLNNSDIHRRVADAIRQQHGQGQRQRQGQRSESSQSNNNNRKNNYDSNRNNDPNEEDEWSD